MVIDISTGADAWQESFQPSFISHHYSPAFSPDSRESESHGALPSAIASVLTLSSIILISAFHLKVINWQDWEHRYLSELWVYLNR